MNTELDIDNPNGCEKCGEDKHMPSECPIDGICDCHLKQSVKDEIDYLRGLLCNGTIDCENSPECPENTDGCVVDDIRQYFKLKESKNEGGK